MDTRISNIQNDVKRNLGDLEKRMHFSRRLVLAGRTDEAKQELRNVLQQNPTFQRARETITSLDPLAWTGIIALNKEYQVNDHVASSLTILERGRRSVNIPLPNLQYSGLLYCNGKLLIYNNVEGHALELSADGTARQLNLPQLCNPIARHGADWTTQTPSDMNADICELEQRTITYRKMSSRVNPDIIYAQRLRGRKRNIPLTHTATIIPFCTNGRLPWLLVEDQRVYFYQHAEDPQNPKKEGVYFVEDGTSTIIPRKNIRDILYVPATSRLLEQNIVRNPYNLAAWYEDASTDSAIEAEQSFLHPVWIEVPITFLDRERLGNLSPRKQTKRRK